MGESSQKLELFLTKKTTCLSPHLSLTCRKFTHTDCLSSQAHTQRGYRGCEQFSGKIISKSYFFTRNLGVVGCGEGVRYLTSWGVQLIVASSWARPVILVAGKGKGGMFLFPLFLHFHSCSPFLPVPLFHLLYYLFFVFSLFLWERTQNDPQGLMCH